jgi:hypothetical protein
MPSKIKIKKEEEDVEAPILKQAKNVLEVEFPDEKGSKVRCLWGRSDVLTVFLLVSTLSVVSVILYHELIVTDGKWQKQLKQIVRTRRHNGEQLSQILHRIEEPKIHGMPIDKAVKVSEACDQAHCTLPCMRGRSQGFGNFLQKALEVAAPILTNVPFLPRVVSTVIGPVTSLVRRIAGHPYSSVSNANCARILDMGSGPDMGGAYKTGPSGMKALEYKPDDERHYYRLRRKRGTGESTEDSTAHQQDSTAPPGEGYAEYLAAMYEVLVNGDDEDEALDSVLTSIFSRLEQ